MMDRNREIACNTDTALLKWIALAFMICDHFGYRLMNNMTEMRMIGRIAFPLYAWCVVVGAVYTRNIWKYALRLLIVGLIAQPCYMLGLNHALKELNIFFTLLLGLLGIAGIREKRFYSQIWGPALMILLGAVAGSDYGWKGVALVLCMYACRGSKGAMAAMMAVFCLFWGASSSRLTEIFGLSLSIPDAFPLSARLNSFFGSFLHLQTMAILSLPLILIPTRSNLRMPKWIAYAAYPAHLLILYACLQLLQP